MTTASFPTFLSSARLALLLLLALADARLTAQTAPTVVSVSNSVVSLPGPWRFQPGDDQVWSSPAFDDSAWSLMDLHSEEAVNPTYGSSGYIKGWTARGYPHLSGFAWYRLRIHIADPATPLAIKMPDATDDAYQVFANGQLLGSFGVFTPGRVVALRSRPESFELPPPDANGEILLAIRFYAESFAIADGAAPDSGGMHQIPLVGLIPQINLIRDQELRVHLLFLIPGIAASLFILLVAAGAFWLWLLDRPRLTYLWLTLTLSFSSAANLVNLASVVAFNFNQDLQGTLTLGLTTLARLCWVFFWRDWFQLPNTRRIYVLVAALGATIVALDTFTSYGFSGISSETALHLIQLRGLCHIVIGLMILWALLQGARKDRTGALLALVPILLIEISNFSTELLNWARIPTVFFLGGAGIAMSDLATILMVLVVGALVARRFLASQVAENLARQSIDQDLEQARVLQQSVLSPEPIRSELFTAESIYYPARTVGGDFYQLVPGRAGSVHEGSLLIVLGDVSGKGMAAAMLVAVLVGAIRSEADHTFDPAAILHTLNQRLLGRAGGHFATVVAACLLPDGTLLLANAGHIPPYLNGRPIQVEGSLPVGLDPEATYDVEAIQLAPEDRLIFLTDGVPEARNATGELLGFEATERLSGETLGHIAQAAIDHGQDDDITILSVEFAGSPAVV